MFAIVLTTVCSLFSLNNMKAFADYTQVGGGSNIQPGGPSSATIYMYKVTVYINRDGTATKESPYGKFNEKAFAYYYKDSRVTRESKAYIGGCTKFDYAVNGASLSATTISKLGNKLIADSSLPTVSVINDTEMSNAFKVIANYFGGSEAKRFRFASDVCSRSNITITKDDSWALMVEPTIRSYVNGRYYYYTPTEYALALDGNKNAEGFGSYDQYNYTMLGYGLTLNRGASVSYISNGAWFGLGSGTVQNTWKDARTEKAFRNQKSTFMKYAGAFVWFSQAFENSDFTLGSVPANAEKFEEEEITISTQIKRTNPSKAGTVNATLKLNSGGFTGVQITDGATRAVSFAKGEDSKNVSWKVKVGSYGDKSANRSYTYDINISPEEGTKDLNMNNNTISGQITLKRDLQVTSVTLDNSECFENSNVTVRFSVKNANPYKAYSNVPVAIYFTYGGKVIRISETTLSFDKGATKNGSCVLNVGCVTDNSDQRDTVTVVLNSSNVSAESGSRYTEPVMTNNKLSASVKVKRDINLSVSIVDRSTWESYIGNAPSKVKETEKTQAVTTCTVTNHSRFNLYESDPMGDKITVNFYVNNKKVGSKSVPIPRYGSNLVWFKWDVPDGSSVTLRAEMVWNVDQENSSSPYADNTSSITKGIKTVNKFSTPDTKLMMEHGSNKNYSKASAYTKFKPSVAKWSQWICNSGGTFTRIDYAMTGDSALALTPMKSAEYYDGNTIASGSALSAVFSYTVRTECSEAGYNVSPNDYTYAQNVVAMFPEFQYTNSGDCRTMYLVKEDGNLGNASFCLEKNPYIEDKQRVHFTPSNMPDGEYKVGVVASSMWTPAGPIYVNAASSVMINGSVYDDWSPNASVR